MSFSQKVKEEILRNKPMRVRFKKPQAYGLFLFGRSFSLEEVSIQTETLGIVELFGWFARDILGKEVELSQSQRRQGAKTIYRIQLEGEESRRRLLEHFQQTKGIHREHLGSSEALGAFVAGAFLACGSLSDPEKRVHLEFAVRDPQLGQELSALLEEVVPGAKGVDRRQHRVIYYKEYGPMEDLLTWMGASQSSLAVMDIETYKSVRNRANRAVNCETANIDKLVGAAASQLEDIALVLSVMGEEGLAEPLLQVARLRQEHPEASLRELAQCSPEPISRSGVHHRLDKLSKMAEEIRSQSQGKEGGHG